MDVDWETQPRQYFTIEMDDCLMLPYNVHKPLFSQKISAILANASSFSHSVASR